MGVDIASKEWSGVALHVGGELLKTDAFKPADERISEPKKLEEYEAWLKKMLFLYKPDIVAVEQLNNPRNMLVVRLIARREGIALKEASKFGAIVINPGIVKSRSIVFGKGNMSKDACWDARATVWGGYDFGRKTTGGLDKMDAATHAKAAPAVLERK